MNRRICCFVALLCCLSLPKGVHSQDTSRGVRVDDLDVNVGKRWAVCIGINEYEDDAILNLNKARNDAKQLGQIFETLGQFDRVFVITDEVDARDPSYPRLRHITHTLTFLEEFVSPEDLIVFSFSGHGVSDSEGNSYLVVADSYIDDLFESSLPLSDILSWLKELGVRKSLLLIDACREYFQESKGINNQSFLVHEFEEAEIAAAFFSTKAGWFSYEDPDSDYGVFTRYLLEGMEGRADSQQYGGNGDGIVTFTELAQFVEEEVMKWALNHIKKQRPYTKIYGEKFGNLGLTYYKAIPDDKPEEGDGFGEFYIVTEPDGAEIWVQGELKGESPLLVKLPLSRTHKVTARKGHMSVTDEVTEEEKGLYTLHLTLKQERGNLIVVSTEEDVAVYLQEQHLGMLGDGVFKALPAGSYDLEIRGEGLYWEGPITIRANETTIARIQPEEVGSLLYYLPEGMKAVLERGDTILTIEGSGELFDLPVGFYFIAIGDDERFSGRESYAGMPDEYSPVRTIQIERGKQSILDRRAKADLIVESSPSGVDVYIDGVVQGTTPILMEGLLVGDHEVELRMGSLRVTQQVSLEVYPRKELFIELVPERFVLVEAGSLLMGSQVRKVTIEKNYFMGAYEVTVAEFRRFAEETGYVSTAETEGGSFVRTQDGWEQRPEVSWRNPSIQQDENEPVVCITWYDAVAYCNWLSIREGLYPCYNIQKDRPDASEKGEDAVGWHVICDFSANGYRLPSEAEWEYAARGGRNSRKYLYAGGDAPTKVAWFAENSEGTTHPGGGKKTNELGIYDMSGNVWEWCWDQLGNNFSRALRGGSWATEDETNLRVVNAGRQKPWRSDYDNGFRVVRNAE